MKSYEGEYLSLATIPMAEGWARRRSVGFAVWSVLTRISMKRSCLAKKQV